MKKIFKIIIGFVAFITLTIIAVFFMTSGFSDIGDNFFDALRNDNMEEAYSYLSQNFQATTSQEELQNFLNRTGLKDVVDVSWGGRSFKNDRGSIEGTVTTVSGGSIPVTINFLEESSGWKILSINTAATGVQNVSNTPIIPSKLEQKKLIRETIHIFGLCVNERSMQKLYDHTAKLWQDQTDAQKFEEVFGKFYDLDLNFLLLDNEKITFDKETYLNEDDVMTIEGHYNTTPKQLNFTQKYTLEGLRWKLVFIGLNVVDAINPS